jgi:hypothetical protein
MSGGCQLREDCDSGGSDKVRLLMLNGAAAPLSPKDEPVYIKTAKWRSRRLPNWHFNNHAVAPFSTSL